MHRTNRHVAAFAATMCGVSAFADRFVSIDLAENRNGNRPSTTYPLGAQVLGGIPFQLATDTNEYCWSANSPQIPANDERTLDLPINQFGVRVVHTLINTIWGEPGPDSSLMIEFVGSEGLVQSVPLVGNYHIRDLNQYCYTNRLDWPEAGQVAGNGNHRMDKQRFVLDSAFRTQTLLLLRLTDTGCGGAGTHCQCANVDCPNGGGCQRAFLSGVTVRLCPGDLDGDNDTDLGDLSSLLAHFGDSGSPSEGDLDLDGDVDIQDLASLLANFGAPCN